MPVLRTWYLQQPYVAFVLGDWLCSIVIVLQKPQTPLARRHARPPRQVSFVLFVARASLVTTTHPVPTGWYACGPQTVNGNNCYGATNQQQCPAGERYPAPSVPHTIDELCIPKVLTATPRGGRPA